MRDRHRLQQTDPCSKSSLVAKRDTLAARETDLDGRQRALDQRERAIAERERKLAEHEATFAERDDALRTERDRMRDERDRLANMLALQSRATPSSDDEDDFGDLIVRKDYSPTLAADENSAPSPPIDGATLARVASRPSLVPRRPLEERRSMYVGSAGDAG